MHREELDTCLENSHFIVKQGIILRHEISSSGIEVDKAKFEVIAKLPELKFIKVIRSFLGHARFYRRLPFEIMCDASHLAISAVLGQRIDNRQHVIYYASRTLNDAQQNCTMTEKEFLAIVFVLKKFRPYLLGSRTTVYMDHSALRYLMTKKDTKARLVQ